MVAGRDNQVCSHWTAVLFGGWGFSKSSKQLVECGNTIWGLGDIPPDLHSLLIDHITGSFMDPNLREQCIFEDETNLSSPALAFHVADRRFRRILVDGLAFVINGRPFFSY